jgi:hypothetical protein
LLESTYSYSCLVSQNIIDKKFSKTKMMLREVLILY